nr:YqgQ family protein [Marinithermofilum abyssi]
MQTYGDVLVLFKRFGIHIYTGDSLGDLELMEDELQELHQGGLIDSREYIEARNILRARRRQVE